MRKAYLQNGKGDKNLREQSEGKLNISPEWCIFDGCVEIIVFEKQGPFLLRKNNNKWR